MRTGYIMAFAASALALAGCQNDEIVNVQDTDVLTIKYAVAADCPVQGRSGMGAPATMLSLTCNGDSLSIPMEWTVTDGIAIGPAADGTRGTLVNDTGEDGRSLSEFAGLIGNTFVAEAFDANGVKKVSQTVTWSAADSAWEGAPKATWPDGVSLDFLAYANLPSGQGASIDSAGVSLTYTVPATASAQTDILFGHYSGNGGGTGTAEIRFRHPLTAVLFKCGEIAGGLKVKSITLGGVAASGTVTMAPDGTVSWSDVSTGTTTVSQGNDSGLPVDDSSKLLGEAFLLIPQTLSDRNVSISVEFTNGDIAACTLAAGKWEEGTTNTCTLGYDPHTYSYTFELTTLSDTISLFENTTSTATKSIGITNKCTRDDSVESPGEYIIKSVQVGSDTVMTINDTVFSNIGGLSASVTSSSTLSLTAAKRKIVNPGLHDYWLNRNPERTDDLDWTPEDWTTATASSPIDLSTFDFRTETPDNHLMTTANCYIIRHAGTYKLPLVYGNAVVGGEVNEQSYFPNCKGDVPDGGTRTTNVGDASNFRLINFKNHLEKDITSAFIENNEGCVAKDAAIVWQDNAEVINSVQIVDGASAGMPGSYTTSSVRYLQFTVDPNTVRQNNAIIAVKDGDGNIMWSWHIWTTNDPELLSNPIAVTNFTDVEYDFFPLNCLGWIDPDRYPSRPDVRIVLQQKKSGKEIEIGVSQPLICPYAGNGCWYQWGRKDPMCTTETPAKGTITQSVTGSVSLSTAIRNPDKYYNEQVQEFVNGKWEYFRIWCETTYYNLWTGKRSIGGKTDQEPDMIKTVYDPSPVGYKMPASNAFTGFTTTGEPIYDFYVNLDKFNGTGGLYYGEISASDIVVHGLYFYTVKSSAVTPTTPTIFFATTGERNDTDGHIEHLGQDGQYWTANVPFAQYLGIYLSFSAMHIYNPWNYNRSFGFAVRPVKE